MRHFSTRVLLIFSDDTLKKFWETEEIPEERAFSNEEKECVEHFESTIERDGDGSYVVSLPFKNDATGLGDTRRMAMAQYLQLERKFERQPDLKRLYTEYMANLLERGFMKKCDQPPQKKAFYLPHHAVLKESTTTKVRPVYNASQKSSNGIALNDILMTGPRLQQDIFDIWLRFRLNAIAFTADIEKMYLHIKLCENDHDMQRMLWRFDSNGPIGEYCLTTVTFGINSSPFLAVAVIQYHAKQRMNEFPEACKIIVKDSYMDDVSSGCNKVEKAIQLQREVTSILAEAGFPLRKWVSNSEELMAHISDIDREGGSENVKTGCGKYAPVLGLLWFYEGDKLGFKANMKKSEKKMTKRSILAEIASIYDIPIAFTNHHI